MAYDRFNRQLAPRPKANPGAKQDERDAAYRASHDQALDRIKRGVRLGTHADAIQTVEDLVLLALYDTITERKALVVAEIIKLTEKSRASTEAAKLATQSKSEAEFIFRLDPASMAAVEGDDRPPNAND